MASNSVSDIRERAVDVGETFGRLRALLGEIAASCSKNDQVIVLIAACIEEGFNRGPRITGALEMLGFNKRHVGMTLIDRAQPGDGQWWSKGEDGVYRLISQPSQMDGPGEP